MYQTICIFIVILIVALTSVLLITYNSFSSACAYVTPLMTQSQSSSSPMFTNIQLMDLAAAGVRSSSPPPRSPPPPPRSSPPPPRSTSPPPKETTYDELAKLSDSTLITNLTRLYPDGKVPTSSNYSGFIDKRIYWNADTKKYAVVVSDVRTSPPVKDGDTVPYEELANKSDQQLIDNLNRLYGKSSSSPGQVPVTSNYTKFFTESKFYWDAKGQTFAVDPDASDKDEVSYPILATRDDDRNLRNLNRMYGSNSSNPGVVPSTSEYQQFFKDKKYMWDSSQNKYVLYWSTSPSPNPDNNVPYDVLKTRDDTVNLQNLNNMYGKTGKYLSTNPPGYVSDNSEYHKFFTENKYVWNADHQQFELVSSTSPSPPPNEDSIVPYDVLKTRDDTVNLQNLNNMYGRTGKYLSTNPPGYVSDNSEYHKFFAENKYVWNADHQQFELVSSGPSYQYQFI